MALSQTDREAIAQIVAENSRLTDSDILAIDTRVRHIVRETIDEHPLSCRFGSVDKDHVGHLFGVLKDIGGQDEGKGIEEFRKSMVWNKDMRDTQHSIKKVGLVTVIATSIGGILTALWIGISAIINRGHH